MQTAGGHLEGSLKTMTKDLEVGGVRMETGSMRVAEMTKGHWVAQSKVLTVQLAEARDKDLPGKSGQQSSMSPKVK